MQEHEFRDLWSSYNHSLQENLRINRQCVADITGLKVKTALNSIRPAKLFAVLFGIIWVIIVDSIIITSFPYASPFFLASAIIQVLLSKLAIGIYLYQLTLIAAIDADDPIVSVQEKLAGLSTSTLWCVRILVLQLPVWTSFFWSKAMFLEGNVFQVGVMVLSFLLACAAAVWLFRNIRIENREKKWFRLLFSGREWESIVKASQMMENLARLKSEA